MAIYVPFNEGQQAEEYKARKEKEFLSTGSKDVDRHLRRYPMTLEDEGFVTHGPGKKNLGKRNSDGSVSIYRGKGDRTEYTLSKRQDIDRDDKAYEKAGKEAKRRAENWDKEITNVKSGKAENLDKLDDARDSYYRLKNNKDVVIDTTNRHIRRHPKQYREEASIFEAVHLI